VKFNVFEDSQGWLSLQIPEIKRVWICLDAEDVLQKIKGLSSVNVSEFVREAPGGAVWDMVCPMGEPLGDLVLNESGFSDVLDLRSAGRFLLDLMFHLHVGDLEVFGKW